MERNSEQLLGSVSAVLQELINRLVEQSALSREDAALIAQRAAARAEEAAQSGEAPHRP